MKPWMRGDARRAVGSFSILERIDVGETSYAKTHIAPVEPFSILERIDVGETTTRPRASSHRQLSVSSNGSTWVKRGLEVSGHTGGAFFQYPRTDRRG